MVSSPSLSPLPSTKAASKESSTGTTKKQKRVKSISTIGRFNCTAKDLFEILMDENRWKGSTQNNERISKNVGGEFSIFNGSVTRNNLELQEGKLIGQKWSLEAGTKI